MVHLSKFGERAFVPALPFVAGTGRTETAVQPVEQQPEASRCGDCGDQMPGSPGWEDVHQVVVDGIPCHVPARPGEPFSGQPPQERPRVPPHEGLSSGGTVCNASGKSPTEGISSFTLPM
jgi:hypothetical protein